jgi:hypothetical protein
MGAPTTWSYYFWRTGELHPVKDNGSGWLRWLLKHVEGHPDPSKSWDNRYALEFPVSDHPRSLGAC